jgi:hypothetical protein
VGACCRLPEHRPDLWDAGDRCPDCGVTGRTVGAGTVRRHVAPQVQRAVIAAQYRFCRTDDCRVVYYGPQRSEVLELEDVATDIGCKTMSVTELVCYCFTHAAPAITADALAHGRSRVRAAIAAEVRAGNCACEVRNPSGRCCLAEVSAVARAALEAVAAEPAPQRDGTEAADRDRHRP